MSALRFVLVMAWRETRGARRRHALLVATIAIGVGALVAINSFTHNLRSSVRAQAREILGADLSLSRSTPYSEAVESALEALAGEAGLRDAVPGDDLARQVSFFAMARPVHGERASLVDVNALEGSYPFYGKWRTEPPGRWHELGSVDHAAIVEPALLINLGAAVGDELQLGEARFTIRASVHDIPGDISAFSSLGPRVYIAGRHLDQTGLVGFGSRARYRTFLRLPPEVDPQRLADDWRERLDPERVVLRTVSDREGRLNEQLGRLGHYLGLVALVALLLGGIGVASAIHVFIQRKLDTLAVLRCLGASTRRLFAVYLAQAGALGLAGSLLGALLGNAVQLALPRLAQGLLPVDVSPAPSPTAMLGGVAVGVSVALLFSLLPLLAVRDVSPLAVLRAPVDGGTRKGHDTARLAAFAALGVGVVAISALQVGAFGEGLAFAAGLGAVLAVLWAAAVGLVRGVRRWFPTRLPYVWRQGLANLYRPANQTVTVVLALGFGAFLLATLFLVQDNLLQDLRLGDTERPNLALIDVQPAQRDALAELLREAGRDFPTPTPIVPMKILEVKGHRVSDFLYETRDRQGRAGRWAFRREYRSTHRDGFSDSERVVTGPHWPPGAWLEARPGETIPVSLERGLAEELDVDVGDEIVWDVQGLPVRSRVASTRDVEWARFEPNFFAVFPEGPLDRAPQSFVFLIRVEDAERRARLQGLVVERFPNVTAFDLSSIQATLETLISRVALAIRFMAAFSLIAGAAVLAGAVAASRLQRMRESVLLKVLGATRRQVLSILFVEYLALGLLAATTAMVLALAGGWAVVELVFATRFQIPAPALAMLGLGVAGITAIGGLAASLDQLRRTPLAALRSE